MIIYKINEDLTIKREGDELVLYLFDDAKEREKYINNSMGTDYAVFNMLDRFLTDVEIYNKHGNFSGTLKDSFEMFKVSNEAVYNRIFNFFY